MSGAPRGQPNPAFAGAGTDSENFDLSSGTVPSGSQPMTESPNLIPRPVSSESRSRAEIENRITGIEAQLGMLMSMVAALGQNPSSSQSRTALTSGEGTTSASSTNTSDNKPETVANFHDSGQEGNSVGQAKSNNTSSMPDGTTNLHGLGQEMSTPEAPHSLPLLTMRTLVNSWRRRI